ncbi:MAG: DUF4198 domain-containing protein [Bryobacteraceae bacterium]
MYRLLLAVVLSSSLPAHDMWIEPSSFTPQAGQIVGLRHFVGQDLIGDPLPRNPALIREFIVDDGTGRKPVAGRTGADPAGLIRIGAAGLSIVGYRSHPSTVELPAEQFNKYLKEEGLAGVAAARALRNETAAPVRELFSRCAKSLLLAGAAGQTQSDRVLGFTLELTAEQNPYGLHPGDTLPVSLTYEGKPLAGALVVAMNRNDLAVRLALRTGKDGRVRLRLPRGGMWLIKAVHMIPAPAGSNANWESFWASLTFELPAAAAAAAPSN